MASFTTPTPLTTFRPPTPPPMAAMSPEFESPPHSESFTSVHALTLVLTVILLLLFFVGFFSIYFCKCFMENLMIILNNRRNPIGAPINPSDPDPPGLHQSIIDSFPIFPYSSVEFHRPENQTLDCAICLSEFQDSDTLRLIPDCCHVFHQQCIDLWLASHTSCPVCRRALDGPEPGPVGPGNEGSSYNINVKEDVGEPLRLMYGEGRFSRSHSTGHSITEPERDDDDWGSCTHVELYYFWGDV